MFKKISFPLAFILSFLPFMALAENAVVKSTHGKWTTYEFIDNGQKVCYMASAPIEDTGNYKTRGEISALITHWPTKDSQNVFSYVAGYPYKNGSTVTVSISGLNFSLFTKGEMAWSADEATDKRLIDAIKNGSKMVVKGTSTKGTVTTDTFSLEGSTAAHNAISKACGVN
jgi:invasion protein IalB